MLSDTMFPVVFLYMVVGENRDYSMLLFDIACSILEVYVESVRLFFCYLVYLL